MDRLTSEQRHRNMQRIKNKNTEIEIALRKELWRRGYRYRKNYKCLPGKPDIVLTKYRIAVFCDSEFFHGKDWDILQSQLSKGKNADFWKNKISRNIEHDNDIDKMLKYQNWTVLRFWGKEIKNNLDGCIMAIEEAIREQKTAEYETLICEETDYV